MTGRVGASIGGSCGEQQAPVTYWRQRLAVANARGVAKVIKARTPFCTGDHYPLQPHHFGHLQAVAPSLQPRQHFPAQMNTCLPCNAPSYLPAAVSGQAAPLRSTISPNSVWRLVARVIGGGLAFLLGAHRKHTLRTNPMIGHRAAIRSSHCLDASTARSARNHASSGATI